MGWWVRGTRARSKTNTEKRRRLNPSRQAQLRSCIRSRHRCPVDILKQRKTQLWRVESLEPPPTPPTTVPARLLSERLLALRDSALQTTFVINISAVCEHVRSATQSLGGGPPTTRAAGDEAACLKSELWEPPESVPVFTRSLARSLARHTAGSPDGRRARTMSWVVSSSSTSSKLNRCCSMYLVKSTLVLRSPRPREAELGSSSRRNEKKITKIAESRINSAAFRTAILLKSPWPPKASWGRERLGPYLASTLKRPVQT